MRGHRAEIDLLRALAIIGVVLFHLQIRSVSGGFVGVDVFLVISGFLITRLLEAPQGKPLRLLPFYMKRLNRLYPALVATICASLAASYFLFLPAEFLQFARSAIFALLGVSNVNFWMEAGYFDAASHLKPLLHTWSLGLELQFYALWPFVMRLDVALRRHLPAGSLLVALALASFGLSLAFGSEEPFTFYLLPARLWEFCAGGILAIFSGADKPRHGTPLALVGLAIILACMAFYGPRTPFPGVFALPPVLGACLCIYAGTPNRLAWLINSRPVQAAGRLSYATYLVHWPLIVFATHIMHGPVGFFGRLAVIALTMLLSILLYVLIEQPFLRPPANSPDATSKSRSRSKFAQPMLIAASGAAICAAMAVWATNGLGAYRMKGMTHLRSIIGYDFELAKSYVWSRVDRFETNAGFKSGKRRLLLIGDSQAADVLNVLLERGLERSTEIIMMRVNSTCGLPYLPSSIDPDVWWSNNPETANAPKVREKCQQAMGRIKQSRALSQADLIVVAFHWRPLAFDHAEAAVRSMADRNSNKLWIVGSKTLGASIPETLATAADISRLPVHAASLIPSETRDINQRLRTAFGSNFVDVLGGLCKPDVGCTLLDESGAPLFSDTLHFTPEGARFISRLDQGGLSPLFHSAPVSSLNSTE